MSITKIQASNIKGRQIDIEPRQVNIVTGANYSGKSAIKNALELALLGYVPGLPKTNKGIFEIGNGEPISVALSIDGNVVISRSWAKRGRTVSKDENVQLEIPAAMMELGSVFDLPKAARLKYFFELAQVDELTMEAVTAAIKNIAVEEASEYTEKAILSTVELVRSAAGDNIQEQLTAAIDGVKERAKIVNAQVKDYAGFSRTITRQADLESPVRNARGKVESVRKQLESQIAIASSANSKLARQERIQQEIEKLSHELIINPVDDTDWQAEKAALEATIARHESEIKDIDIQGLAVKQSSLAQKLGETHGEIKALRQQAQQLKDNHLQTMSRLAQESAELATELDELQQSDVCPTCGTEGTHWQERVLERYKAKMEANQQQQQAEVATYRAQNLEGSQAYKTATTLLASTQEGLGAIDAQTHRLGEITNQLEDSRARLREMVEHRQKLEQKDTAVKAQINALKEELASTDWAALQATTEKSSAVEAQLREQLDEATRELQQETAAMTKQLEIQKSVLRRQVVEAELLILKAAQKVLLELQEQAIESAFSPILSIANQFTNGILRAPLSFHETELGYWDGANFISHRTFSGTEEALAYTGIMVALASVSGSPIKVAIVDEMGRFEPLVTRPAVVERMIDLTARGVIDHAFLIDPDTSFYSGYAGRDEVLLHEVRQLIGDSK